ncbi:MAG: ABC transporter permease, partial [Phaeodactylibacter sp.]|nr:ABC transporter permease [Phaeodactylibacter sp.]
MVFYLTALIQGLCLAAMGLGIFITMKIFRIPDITTDGSYTLGAAVTAVLLTQGWPLLPVAGATVLVGALAGVMTGLVHTRLKIDALLAGILVMTGLYS